MLSIILVNYKSADLSLDCISSLYSMNPDLDAEIILVDNHSEDGIQRQLEEKFPKVKFVQMGYNAGFGRANNRGIQDSSGESILFLNNDTLCTDDSITRAYHYFNHQKLAGLGIRLLNPDGTPQHSGYYFVPFALNFLLNIPYLGRCFSYCASLFKMKKPYSGQENVTEKVDWINGAFLMTPRKAIDQVGAFDEDFFLYSEEVEFCARLHKYGSLEIKNDLSIIHLQGESVGRKTNNHEKGYQNLSGKKGLQVLLSGLLRIRKQYGIFLLFVHLAIYTLSTPLFLILGLLESMLKMNMLHASYSLRVAINVCSVYRYLIPIIVKKPLLYKVI